MVKKFEKGKRYKFDLNNFILSSIDNEILTKDIKLVIGNNGWTKDCIDKEIKIISENLSTIGRYYISPSWCVEIGDDN